MSKQMTRTEKKKQPDRYRRMEMCRECDGVGWYEGFEYLQTECDKCHGTGEVVAEDVKI